MRTIILVPAFLFSLLAAPLASALDEAAAKAYAKQNDCFKCHAPDKTKKGPSYKKISEKFRDKYKGKAAEGEAKMFEHLTTAQKVKLEDGTEEEHKALDKKEADKIRNIIEWVRSH